MSDDFIHLLYLKRQHWANVLATPDAFNYYRPVAQATLLANLQLAGERPAVFRLINLLLHAGVVAAAFAVARMVLGRRRAAILAALAFALTPKAAQIAILWTSARADLLMALFSLGAIAAWVRWSRSGGTGWIATSSLCYTAAVLSKESAVLLPVLLLLTPPRPTARRIPAVLTLAACAVAVLAMRIYAGARTPLDDPNYHVLAPLTVDVANGFNYFMRAIPAPLALMVIALVAAIRADREKTLTLTRTTEFRKVGVYAAVWLVVFIAPVLPMPSRSELYVYFSGFGFCLLGALVADALLPERLTRSSHIALAVYVVSLGAYQITLASRTHDVLLFSAKLVEALENDSHIPPETRTLVLVPADEPTDRLLQIAISGYVDIVVRMTTNRPDLSTSIARPGEGLGGDALRLTCQYRDATLRLSRVGAPP
jgi:hypothetical protein